MDESLYVPWKGSPSGMISELKAIESIQRKNLREFEELREAITGLPILSIKCPDPVGLFTTEQYRENEIKSIEAVEKCNNEYEGLLRKETQLLQEINDLNKSSQKRTSEIDALEEECAKKKKIYKEEKAALILAKEAYNQAFGMSITVEEGSGDLFVATVNFDATGENSAIKFTINRITKEIIDFDASSLGAGDKLQVLRSDFKNTRNALALIHALRNFAINS